MNDFTFAVCDFWAGHDPSADPMIRALTAGMEYTSRIEGADLTICSTFGDRHRRARGALVMFNGEPSAPGVFARKSSIHFRIDWMHDSSPDHLRVPIWAYGLREALAEFDTFSDGSVPSGRRFCNFIYSNHGSPMRNAFFELLHREKPVDALGLAHRNLVHPGLAERSVTGGLATKLAVQGEYRFTIAFENSEHVGYTTEKLLHAWSADTVPIYWGNPAVEVDFAPGSFLSLNRAGSMAKLVKLVLEVDDDPELYEHYRALNPLRTGEASRALERYAAAVDVFSSTMRTAIASRSTDPVRSRAYAGGLGEQLSKRLGKLKQFGARRQ